MNRMNAAVAMTLFMFSIGTCNSQAAEVVLEAELHHLRSGSRREWSDFPETTDKSSLRLAFHATSNGAPSTLRLRQQDVKQVWNVRLNGNLLGQLVQDENDQIANYVIPTQRLRDGDNELVVEPTTATPDDIRIGEVTLIDRPVGELLNQARVELRVVDSTAPGRPSSIPCRMTIVSKDGVLVPVGAMSDANMAVRTGVIYSADGRVEFGLPAGDFTIYAGRGFEYSIATSPIRVQSGDVIQKTLEIRRDVPTPGWVSCDTHIHTLTYSGHGDATLAERVVSIAGEGIELPVATEHNLQVDYSRAAETAGVRKYFTPLVGNEVTTPVGHFNVFPATAGAIVPLFDANDGTAILRDIALKAHGPFTILNHPSDLHRGYRPFDPVRHVSLSGENDDKWLTQVHGVEVINSGAQQTDMLKPLMDWFGMLNGGVFVTPIGASDSHDVNRFIVGQARTYVRCHDGDAGHIDRDQAVANLRAGRVLVSCGLLADIQVNGSHEPGDLVPNSPSIEVRVRVLGPEWVTAEQVTLYANGIPIREATIIEDRPAGTKWETTWKLPPFQHDVYLSAIAVGPPVEALYWPIARPYQPASEHCSRRVLGATGAVWIDADGNGKRTPANQYAATLWSESGQDLSTYIPELNRYDEAVATQAAALLTRLGVSLLEEEVQRMIQRADAQVVSGFQKYIEAWRVGQLAKAATP